MTKATKKATKATATDALNKELEQFETKSAKIRFLASKGKTRSEIASILGIRYQHANNVLSTELKRKPKS